MERDSKHATCSECRAPRVSIVMPIFNNIDCLKATIDSILAGTLGNWELLAVDDGSDEETLELLETYAQKDNRIRVIRRERLPKGAPTCRNIGLAMAQGEYIVFFDSDDYVAPHCLLQRVSTIAARPELDFMVFPSGLFVDNSFSEQGQNSLYGYPLFSDDLAGFASRELPFIVWNNIYRTLSLRQHSITWDEELRSLQDADFNLSTLLSGMKYEYASARPDYGYRILYDTSSVSAQIMTEKHYSSHLHALRTFYERYSERFGHTYDRHLFRGVLSVYNTIITRQQTSREFNKELASLVGRYDKFSAFRLRCTMLTHQLLCRFMPSNSARKLSMLFYLVGRNKRNKQRLAKIHSIAASTASDGEAI